MTRTAGRRRGLTLIELLVVIAVVIAIAAIAALGVRSSYYQSQKVVSGADRVGGWLLIAKQRAKRDNLPVGVRFFRNAANPTQVTEAQYIELPDPVILNPGQEQNPNGPRIVMTYHQAPPPPPASAYPAVDSRTVFLYVSDPLQNAAYLAEFDARVSVGDLLVLPELAGVHRVAGITTPAANAFHFGTFPPPAGVPLTAANSRQITLVSYTDLGAAHTVHTAAQPYTGTLVTYKFAFQGQAKPLAGEPLLQLTGEVCVDWRDNVAGDGVTSPLNPYFVAGAPLTTIGVSMDPGTIPAPTYRHFDVLFAPDGHVLNNNQGLVCLWVRDPGMIPHPRLPNDAAGFNEAGEQLLVTVYTQTGLIATHPISNNFALADPWRNAKDGINSGF